MMLHDTYHDKYHVRLKWKSSRDAPMTATELQEHVAKLRQVNADHTHVEAKLALNEMPKRLWETLSAFSNTLHGGVLILGISEQERFKITGVNNASKMQHDLANLCSEMDPPVRAHIELHRISGKT